jgi:hypothetical protein
VLLSTPLHASSNFTVSVQLANKRGFTKKNIIQAAARKRSSSAVGADRQCALFQFLQELVSVFSVADIQTPVWALEDSDGRPVA